MLAYCVDFPCNPPRIAAENCLVCGAKILAIRRTPLTKTASQQKRRFVLPLYHAKLLNCDYRIARFAPFCKRKTDFFAFCPQTPPFRSGFRCICTKDKKNRHLTVTVRLSVQFIMTHSQTHPLRPFAGRRWRWCRGPRGRRPSRRQGCPPPLSPSCP